MSEKGEKLIATNPHAGSDFFLAERVEAGMVLTGTEVKSIREQSPNLREAFVEVNPNAGHGLEAWILNMHIAPYSHGNLNNHEPRRKRKLLLHRRQLDKIHAALTREGMTAVPTRMYFTKGLVKLEIALAKGKKKHDRREDLKKRSAEREMDHARKKQR